MCIHDSTTKPPSIFLSKKKFENQKEKKENPYPPPRKFSPLNNSLPNLFSFTLHKHYPPPAQRRQQ